MGISNSTFGKPDLERVDGSSGLGRGEGSFKTLYLLSRQLLPG